MDFVPGVGFWEIVLIATIAFLVVGPRDLPLMMRKAGRMLAKVRAMASDFRASFDEMARQAELEELRREVDALRQEAQSPIIPPYSDPGQSFAERGGVRPDPANGNPTGEHVGAHAQPQAVDESPPPAAPAAPQDSHVSPIPSPENAVRP